MKHTIQAEVIIDTNDDDADISSLFGVGHMYVADDGTTFVFRLAVVDGEELTQ